MKDAVIERIGMYVLRRFHRSHLQGYVQVGRASFNITIETLPTNFSDLALLKRLMVELIC